MEIGDDMKYLVKIKNTTIFTSIIYFAIGVLMLLNPEFVSNSICYVIGALVLAFGILKLVSYLGTEVKNLFTGILLFTSIISIGLGIYIIFSPEKFISMIPFLVGIIMIVDGIQKLIQVESIKKAGYDKPTALLIYAIFLIILGVILLKNPFGAIKIVIRIIGVFLIVDAIEELITVKKYEKVFKEYKEKDSKEVKIIDEQ